MITDEREIQVRPTPDLHTGLADAPREFSWQGRLHRVRRVLGHRRLHKETWRVEAVPVRAARGGVFEMSFDWRTGRWHVTRISLIKEES